MDITKYKIDERKYLPNSPGIYKFYDKNNVLIYVGKAKDIKKRVSSYFNASTNTSLKTKKMAAQIYFIEYTTVNNEAEALQLESNLIKNNYPRYNILLRDDKSFPYICILKERFPRVISIRNPQNYNGQFFGPFTDTSKLNHILELIKSIYKIRTCKYNLSKANIDKKKFKVCLEYHIKNCKGPCENLQSEEEYNRDIKSITDILKGNFSAVKKDLKEEMDTACENLNFELAHELKLKIKSLENYYHKSLIINPAEGNNIDVFAICSNEKKAFVSYLKILKGMITFTQTLEIDKKLDESNNYILARAITYIREKYSPSKEKNEKLANSQNLTKEILTNLEIGEEILDLDITVPKIGDKKKLVNIAYKNCMHAMKASLMSSDTYRPKHSKVLEILQEDLDLKHLPYHIECFDNSNIQGTTPVASMVCFKNAKPCKSEYRKFNIKTVEGPNDFASMSEVVYRRYKSIIEKNEKLPNLIVIDGGKGQLSSALKSLKELEINTKVEVISIAKRLEEMYKPNDPYPLHLNKLSPSLKLIQQIRDEAHRFAITFHKQKRNKASLSSKLDNIPGIGPKTIKDLISHFKSLKNISKAPLDDIKNIIGNKKAEIIEKNKHLL